MENKFRYCKTVNGVKKLYRELCFLYHPDLHLDQWERYNELMKVVNDQYQKALLECSGQKFTGSDGKERTYKYNEDIEEELAQKIQDLISVQMQEVEILLVGTWIWVSGNTKPHKDTLKEMGLRWHSKRKMWYFRKAQYRRRYSGKDFSEIKNMYGVQVVRDNQTGNALPA